MSSKRLSKRRSVLTFIAASMALLALPAGATAAGPQLSSEGRWITDPQGRVVILHGVNMVYKRPPYAPRAIGFGRDDAAFLARHGFNTVRLGVIYAGVEPEPRQFDADYIGSIQRTQRQLARHRIFSLIDFHQDLYAERFQGEGFPEWAIDDDGLPAEPKLGFPANYLAMPALNRAFDHFWANDVVADGRGLQDAYARGWRFVARRFREAPFLMGYDILNEPWPGSVYPTCLNPVGCPAFDEGPLAAMTRAVTAQVRRVDRSNIVWHEPNVIFNNGAMTSLPAIGPSPIGFSFHDYCLTAAEVPFPAGQLECDVFDGLVFDNADAHAEKTGRALLLSEFGATDDATTNRRVIELADEHLVSWQYWHYCDCRDPTTTGTGVQSIVSNPRKPPSDGNLDRPKLDLLERPYPQRVAGTPRRFDYDEEGDAFELVYRKAKAGGGSFKRGMTVIYVPRSDYPDGYRATASGGRVVSKPRSSRLRVRGLPGAHQVEVRVTPP